MAIRVAFGSIVGGIAAYIDWPDLLTRILNGTRVWPELTLRSGCWVIVGTLASYLVAKDQKNTLCAIPIGALLGFFLGRGALIVVFGGALYGAAVGSLVGKKTSSALIALLLALCASVGVQALGIVIELFIAGLLLAIIAIVLAGILWRIEVLFWIVFGCIVGIVGGLSEGGCMPDVAAMNGAVPGAILGVVVGCMARKFGQDSSDRANSSVSSRRAVADSHVANTI